MNPFEAQNKEFYAVAELAKQYQRLTLTPVVDDDYPSVRNAYESSLARLIEAMKANDRFPPGNRYGLQAELINPPSSQWDAIHLREVVNHYNRRWPADQTSGVLFWRGTRITIEEFRKEAAK